MQLTEKEKKAVKLLYLVWKSIDFSKMSSGRLMRIWGEFEAKVRFSAYKPTAEQFLTQMKKTFGISTFKNAEILELLEKDILLEMRKNYTKLILILRSMIQLEKEEYKKLKSRNGEKKSYKKSVDELMNEFLEVENKNELEITENVDLDDEFDSFFK